MSSTPGPQVAIVDFRLGNLFSVEQACQQVGLRAVITSSPQEIMGANEEDARWRKEVLRRLDILVNNQRILQGMITGEKYTITEVEK